MLISAYDALACSLWWCSKVGAGGTANRGSTVFYGTLAGHCRPKNGSYPQQSETR